jgi:hypothetical protein
MIDCEKITHLWANAIEMRKWLGPYKQAIADDVKVEFIEKNDYIHSEPTSEEL